jgi:endonuclease V-like protein UPF0215 family
MMSDLKSVSPLALIIDQSQPKERGAESVMAIGKVTSSKWLPQVHTDKKKADGTRITIGVTEVQAASPFHV